ncbi:MAG TPA: hypothetical protein VGP72_04815 [Planctomycetota bacterium]|jgi:hypothetical protein
MPPTTENIPEKAPFDVYGMLLILSVIFTGGAAWILHDDLDRNWEYRFLGDKATTKHAENLTEVSDNPEKGLVVKVRKQDREEWAIAYRNLTGKEGKFPIEGYEWPEGFNPLETPIKPNDPDILTTLPEAARGALMKTYNVDGTAPEKKPEPTEEKKGDATTPAPDEKKGDATTPEKKADAPAVPEKKADAPEEKKADAPAVPEKKADAPEEKKADAPAVPEKKADAPEEKKAQ